MFTTVLLCIFAFFLRHVAARDDKMSVITWCTVSSEEQRKCEDFARAVNTTVYFKMRLRCEQVVDKDHCMSLIDDGRANLVTLDPGEVYVAGRYDSLIPIMAEQYGPERAPGYYAVAVVPSTLTVRSLIDLEARKACFPGVGQMAGWVIPIGLLIEKEIIEVRDCNNLIKSAAAFFGPSCAPNSLIDKYNPTGDNPQQMCEICGSEKTKKCSGSDAFANFDGAFRCLNSGGDVAFLKHTTVDEETSKPGYRGPNRNQFRLVCPDGRTANIDSYMNCNWGFVPAHSVVTTTATLPERRSQLQNFLTEAVMQFGPGSTRSFHLFSHSELYSGRSNLMFQDAATNLVRLKQSQQTFAGYLGNVENYQQKLLKCPIQAARLCIVSDQEMKKCLKMKTAFRAQMLKPDLSCVRGFSHTKCMQMITENLADLVVLDAGDIYQAGLKYNLMPIISELYDLEEPAYYVIAVARQSDKDTDLLYLKGKRSCHTGIGMAAGWVIPMNFLLTNERMRSYGCDSAHAAAEFFQKSCVPGALSREYTVGDWYYGTLCDLCHGSSSHFCARSSQEPFYGHTGALRCLVEGGGEIAFVKHTTIQENTAGKNPEWWARPMMPDDFELLCRDGTRQSYDQHEKCNLAKVASNAIVTHRNKPPEYINAYRDLFMYAQQYYGSKYSDEFTFKMFVSEEGYSDLIFQDATQQLKVVPEEKRDYREYLGNEFLQAMRIVDCTAAGISLHCSSRMMLIVMAVIVKFISL